MTTTDNDFFRGFGTASIRGGGNFLAPGVYDLSLTALIRKTSENPSTAGHRIVIGEFVVDDVVTAYPADHGTAPPGAPPDWSASNQRGEKVSYIQNFTRHHAMAMGNTKGLLLAVLNVKAALKAAAEGKPPPALLTETSLTPEQWEAAIGKATTPPGEWAKGVRVRAHVGKTRTKEKKPFSPVTWSPLPVEVQAKPATTAAHAPA